MNVTKRKGTQRLVIPARLRPPKIYPPAIQDVRSALKFEPADRTPEENQIIFKHLLLNPQIMELLEKSTNVEKLAEEATYKRLNRGDVLFFEGDDTGDWYLVLSGTVDAIIRLFLVAEDCLFDSESPQDTEFAPLMSKMDLDLQHNKLRRVSVMEAGDVFAYHSYIIDSKRNATIVSSSEYTELIVFPQSIFNEFCLINEKGKYRTRCEIIRKAFTRLRQDQIERIGLLATIKKIPSGNTITQDNCFGRYIYVVTQGTIARYRVVDFTDLSFRTINAPFHELELQFPNGMQPVHIDDLQQGSVFVDPSVRELTDNQYNIKTTTDVQLLSMDIDYFKIIVGEFELERVRQDIKSSLSDEQVIKIWVEDEKKKLWSKFKRKTTSAARLEYKSDLAFKTGKMILRTPSVPTSIKAFKYRKIIPYAPSHLSKKPDFSESMEF